MTLATVEILDRALTLALEKSCPYRLIVPTTWTKGRAAWLRLTPAERRAARKAYFINKVFMEE